VNKLVILHYSPPELIKVERILLIEDDATLNRNISDALKAENFFTETAFDGVIAEKLLKKNNYDCVVLDINIPYKNGYEVCKSFRLYNATTPVILLTAFDELEDKVEGYQSGADDYLTKPFYMKELILRIHALIKRSKYPGQHQENPLIVFREITINSMSKTVSRCGVNINLTPREYEILLMLVKARGELVSKKDLIRQIWGKTTGINTNTIEVYINLLRNKIDKPYGYPIIKTRVGYGYYLEAES
jgi:DNA-binding response OmpR family regulator